MGEWIPRTLFPGWAGVFTIFFDDNVVDGRRVVFSDPDPKVIAAAGRGRRTASLLVQGTPPVQPATPAVRPSPAARAPTPPRPAVPATRQ